MCGGGADHQQDHDHRDAFGACLHDRDRPRRDRGCEEGHVSIPFEEKSANAISLRLKSLSWDLVSQEWRIAGGGSVDILLAGVGETGRHIGGVVDGCGRETKS